MPSPAIRTLAAAMLALATAACQSTAGVMPSSSIQGDTPAPTAAQFTDIFIPSGAKFYIERTLVFGQTPWYGQVALSMSGEPNAAFETYRREMPAFGWQEITSIRAPTSTITYMREDRVATIQIAGGRLTGSDVLIVVSPKGGSLGGGGAPSSIFSAPVSSGPASPAPVRPAR